MYSHDPVSLLALHHSQHSELVAQALMPRRRSRVVARIRARARRAYYRALRRARAARGALAMPSGVSL